MEKANLEVKPQFSQPVRQIVMMLIVVGLTTAGATIAAPSVLPVFISNVWLNGFIFMVFLIGVVSCFAQVAQLIYCVRWIENFAANPESVSSKAPLLLAPLATLLGSRSSRMKIGASSNSSILDSVSTRIEEAREITRYIVNTLIFLGLLGTFYGLATTVPALVETIRSLAPLPGEDGLEVFSRLMNGLESQLDGMGVAFASSLLGLAGSLVVGLLELFAGHGQNRFFRELEEWLSSITRLGFATADSDGSSEQGLAAVVFAQMSEQLENIQDMFIQSDTSRAAVDQKLGLLGEALGSLANRMEANAPSTQALERVAMGQERLLEVLASIEHSEAMDAESRMRLRSIDVQLLRLLEEISTGRQESTSTLRNEIEILTNAIRTATGQANGAIEKSSDIDQQEP
ncbi:MAG: biopolymer transporter ExbB [Paracoccaceae bacterium]|nr:biopolymer transporter ExbB [Paracoccaceae bacterium]